MPIHVALYQPEIAPNTGNIIRLCANTGAQLHLIHPLGFALDDKRLRRAGLDYHEWANVQEHADGDVFLNWVGRRALFACSSKVPERYDQVTYPTDCVLLFGPESRGLPAELREHPNLQGRITIPMRTQSRSLNLANAVAVIVYEVWRQTGFSVSIQHPNLESLENVDKVNSYDLVS